MEKMKISILVPIFGTGEYIARCAHSLFKQNYENLEFIFVNDDTNDNAVEILQQVISLYPNRKENIKVISHQKNEGLAKARLTGIENATGDYIWCIDSDDYIDKCALDIIKEYIHLDFDIIFFDYTQHSSTGESVISRKK